MKASTGWNKRGANLGPVLMKKTTLYLQNNP